MEITVSLIKRNFEKFNRMYFGNELPTPNKFVLSNAKSFIGQFHWRRFYGERGATSTLKISTFYDLNKNEFEGTLLHEMIHCWQWFHGYMDSHGATFQRKALEINVATNYVYNISRLAKLSEKTKKSATSVTAKPRTKGSYITIMTYTRPSGATLFGVPAQTRLNSIYNGMVAIHPEYEIHFYRVINSPLFNLCKKSQRFIHGYKITPEVAGIIKTGKETFIYGNVRTASQGLR